MEPRQPPGFTHPDLDEMSWGDWLFVCFMGHGPEEVRATQTIYQGLAEAAGEAWSMCFEDIVPKPYQEFKDVFSKESFNELLDWKKWDHAIELIQDSQALCTKINPLAPVKQKQLDDFLDKNLNVYAHLSHWWHPQSSSSKIRMGAFTSSRIIVHIFSLIVLASTIYLASMLESATVGCFFEFQVVAPPESSETYPETDRWLSRLFSQSTSKYKVMSDLLSPE